MRYYLRKDGSPFKTRLLTCSEVPRNKIISSNLSGSDKSKTMELKSKDTYPLVCSNRKLP